MILTGYLGDELEVAVVVQYGQVTGFGGGGDEGVDER